MTDSTDGSFRPALDQRKHARFGVDSNAIVSVLGVEEYWQGQIVDLSQKGLRINLPVNFPIGEILRVESGDEVFVAVVCHTRPMPEGYFTIGTRMMHSIKRVHLDALVGEWGI